MNANNQITILETPTMTILGSLSEDPDGIQRPLVVTDQGDAAGLEFPWIGIHDRDFGCRRDDNQIKQRVHSVSRDLDAVM